MPLLKSGKPNTFYWYSNQNWHLEYISYLDSFDGYIWPVETKSEPREKLIIPQELLDGV